MRLLKSAHIGPTMVVTLITFLLAQTLWPFRESASIALAIFLGQLCVGWTNDLVDEDMDREQERTNKPLAQGLIQRRTLLTSTAVALFACVLLSLLGPLGIRGGLVHLLGVACGLSYNFYFKKSLLSPLPYIVAFAALPLSLALSKGYTPPTWTLVVGGAFGLAAHFANVLKDLEADRAANIFGLPQLLGVRNSKLIAGFALLLIAFVLPVSFNRLWIAILAILAIVAILRLTLKYSFVIIMALSVADVLLLITSGASLLGMKR